MFSSIPIQGNTTVPVKKKLNSIKCLSGELTCTMMVSGKICILILYICILVVSLLTCRVKYLEGLFYFCQTDTCWECSLKKGTIYCWPTHEHVYHEKQPLNNHLCNSFSFLVFNLAILAQIPVVVLSTSSSFYPIPLWFQVNHTTSEWSCLSIVHPSSEVQPTWLPVRCSNSNELNSHPPYSNFTRQI